ncbi:MAG: hypothetical protein ACK4TP_02830 [Hyphomicrobium sp.]
MHSTPLLARLLLIASVPLAAPPAWGQTLAARGTDTTPAAATAIAKGTGPQLLAEGPPPPPYAAPPSAKIDGRPAHGPGPGPLASKGPPPHGPGPHQGPRPDIAEQLSRLEVEVGIRTAQLDAWRDFTDAMIAVLKPPHAPEPDRAGESADESKRPRAPFDLPQRIAADAVSRGRSGEALQRAIDNLRTKLTPEQLERVALFEARIAPPPHPAPPPAFHGGDGPPSPPPGR